MSGKGVLKAAILVLTSMYGIVFLYNFTRPDYWTLECWIDPVACSKYAALDPIINTMATIAHPLLIILLTAVYIIVRVVTGNKKRK